MDTFNQEIFKILKERILTIRSIFIKSLNKNIFLSSLQKKNIPFDDKYQHLNKIDIFYIILQNVIINFSEEYEVNCVSGWVDKNLKGYAFIRSIRKPTEAFITKHFVIQHQLWDFDFIIALTKSNLNQKNYDVVKLIFKNFIFIDMIDKNTNLKLDDHKDEYQYNILKQGRIYQDNSIMKNIYKEVDIDQFFNIDIIKMVDELKLYKSIRLKESDTLNINIFYFNHVKKWIDEMLNIHYQCNFNYSLLLKDGLLEVFYRDLHAVKNLRNLFKKQLNIFINFDLFLFKHFFLFHSTNNNDGEGLHTFFLESYKRIFIDDYQGIPGIVYNVNINQQCSIIPSKIKQLIKTLFFS